MPNNYVFRKSLLIPIIVLFLGINIIPPTMSKTECNYNSISCNDYKNILYSPMNSKITYLIDSNNEIIHTWTSNFKPGLSVYMLENGNIIRAAKKGYNPGGGIQEITWNGTIIWDFTYINNEHCSHHDIEPLPNGDILMISWEYKTSSEAIAAGRDPNNIPDGILIPDYIIEVKPTGPTSGEIVWEWHLWDHLIQDYDSSKDNYGVISEHPELIDINYESNLPIEINDWTHLNTIDYNPDLDQIILSSWAFCEIWIIDHSTTTEEAAGHTGGNSSKGGDLLYRWGNPQTYHAGTINDQKFFGQHDSQWIEPGCPGEGNILVFNNGLGRSGPDFSSVEEIEPPIDTDGNYFYNPGSNYEPEDSIWNYTAENPTDFYSNLISGTQRLPNGNTLICNGAHGIFFEVTTDKSIVWEYVNPYPNYYQNNVFKIRCYPLLEPDLACEGELYWTNIVPGDTITGSFILQNIGAPDTLLDWEIIETPDWGDWLFDPNSGTDLESWNPIVVDVKVVAPDTKDKFTGELKIINSQNPDDFEIIDISLTTTRGKLQTNNILMRLFECFPNVFSILRFLLQRFDLQ